LSLMVVNNMPCIVNSSRLYSSKPPAHQASTTSLSHQLVASSRHQYGR
jgi:hypothetical protein